MQLGSVRRHCAAGARSLGRTPRTAIRLHTPVARASFAPVSTSVLSRKTRSIPSKSKFSLHTSAACSKSSRGDNKVPSETPPTDFNSLDVLGNTPAPSTSVDVCFYDGFGLNSGVHISGGNAALLVNGEAFEWRPWEVSGKMELVTAKGFFEIPEAALGVFDALWPRPDLLVIGTGRTNVPLSPKTKQHLAKLGIRVEAMDTRNAAAQFNLMATERGISEIAGALIPIGWQEGIGAK